VGWTGLAGTGEIKCRLTVEIRPTRESRVLEVTESRLIGLGQPSDRICMVF